MKLWRWILYIPLKKTRFKRGDTAVIFFIKTKSVNIIELVIKLELLDRVKGLSSVSTGL